MATKVVNTAGGADYTSLNACLAANTADGSLIVQCTGGSDTTAVSFSGYGTGFNVLIQNYTGNAATKSQWYTDRYNLAVSDAACFTNASNANGTLTIQGIQISSDSTTTDNRGAILCRTTGATTNTFNINYCRIRKNGATTGVYVDGVQVYSTSAITVNLRASIIYGFSRASSGAVVVYEDTVNVFNCDLFASNYGIYRSAGTVTANRNAVGNNTDDFSGTITADYNISDDGDGTNANAPEGASWANEFTDVVTNFNFTLLNSGNAYHSGNDVGGAYTDMDGDAYYATASRGADEEASGGTVYTIASTSTLLKNNSSSENILFSLLNNNNVLNNNNGSLNYLFNFSGTGNILKSNNASLGLNISLQSQSNILSSNNGTLIKLLQINATSIILINNEADIKNILSLNMNSNILLNSESSLNILKAIFSISDIYLNGSAVFGGSLYLLNSDSILTKNNESSLNKLSVLLSNCNITVNSDGTLYQVQGLNNNSIITLNAESAIIELLNLNSNSILTLNCQGTVQGLTIEGKAITGSAILTASLTGFKGIENISVNGCNLEVIKAGGKSL